MIDDCPLLDKEEPEDDERTTEEYVPVKFKPLAKESIPQATTPPDIDDGDLKELAGLFFRSWFFKISNLV